MNTAYRPDRHRMFMRDLGAQVGFSARFSTNVPSRPTS